MSVLEQFDELIEEFSGYEAETNQEHQGDAIDDVLESSPRETEVRDFKTHPDVREFRDALRDGLLTADTVIRFLQLLQTLLSRW